MIDIASQRLASQELSIPLAKTPQEVVRQMCAIQAQNYPMAKWAIGVRTPGITDDQVEGSINRGEILRTHLLRPTWHFVCPADIHWMIRLTAPCIRSAMNSRHKQLELTTAVVNKSNDIICRQIAENGDQTREEIAPHLEAAGIATNDNRLAHLLMLAELEGLICSGRTKGKKQSYALLEERVPKKTILHRDEALFTLARRYFSSRGPATVRDFAWWSGLPVRDAKNAVAHLGSEFMTESINGQVYYWHERKSVDTSDRTLRVVLLPAYDEYLIAYRDRSACLAPQCTDIVVSKNGMFWPVVVAAGHIQGLWKRKEQPQTVSVKGELFAYQSPEIIRACHKRAEEFAAFIDKDLVSCEFSL